MSISSIGKKGEHMFRQVIAAIVLLILSALGAQGQSCPTLPPDSPVLSQSQDDIPVASNGWIATVTSTIVKSHPNQVMAFVQIDGNTQAVWFSIDTDPGLPTVYYNQRHRANSTAPWYWKFSESQPVLSFPPPASVAVDAVLYSPVAKYGQTGWPTLYKYVMYATYQPVGCASQLGFMMASFSNDGTCWTAPSVVTHAGGPSSPCMPAYGANLVQIESVGAIDDGSTIHFIGVNGDVATLMNGVVWDTNQATYGYTSPSQASSVTVPSQYVPSLSGIFSPNGIPSAPGNRYKTYSFFMNMSLAYDDVSGDLILSRGYPYPFDRSDPVSGATASPSSSQLGPWMYVYNYYRGVDNSVQGCAPSPATYPNRVQLYKMHIGSLANITQAMSGTWTMIADIGGSTGYEVDPSGVAVPLVAGQTNVGQDYGNGSFLRDGSGHLVTTSGIATFFAAHTVRETKSSGPCNTTGNEREVAIAFNP